MPLIDCWARAFACLSLISGALMGFICLAFEWTGGAASSLALGVGGMTTLSLVIGMLKGYTAIQQSLIVTTGLFFLVVYRDRLSGLMQEQRGAPVERAAHRGVARIFLKDGVWLALPLVYFLTRFMTAGLPAEHSDPLYYHLLAPKFWAESSQIRLTMTHPSYAQATLWETLYGLPQLWFGTKGVERHITTEIASQWLHVLWGQGGCVFLGAVLLKRLAPGTSPFLGMRIFMAWLCTTLPGLEWLGGLAKNDYILTLFVLAATIEMLDGRWFLGGLCAGFAYSVKVLGAWSVLGLMAFLPLSRKAKRSWLFYAGGVALASMTVLARNLVFTGNPLFPNLDSQIGPHWISSWWVNHNLSYGGPIKFDLQMLKWAVSQLFHKELPKILLFLGALAVIRRTVVCKVFPRDTARWCLFLSIQIALALLMLRPAADGRYAGYVSTLFVLFAGAAILRELASLAIERSAFKWGMICAVLLSLGLLINSPVDQLVKVPRDYLFASADRYVERFHPLFKMQQWVAQHVTERQQILFLAEKQNFFLDRDFETVMEMKKWEEILAPISSARQLFEVLSGMGYRYAHFSPQAGGYPIALRPYWGEIVALQDQAVFKSSYSLIFDLAKLTQPMELK